MWQQSGHCVLGFIDDSSVEKPESWLSEGLCAVHSCMAWEIFHSYIQRWDIEQAFRFNKSELGIESIRLYAFDKRLKMMALVTLVYDFLLQFWRNWKAAALMLINKWCPRTHKRFLKAQMPIYRPRAALFALLFTLMAQYPREVGI